MLNLCGRRRREQVHEGSPVHEPSGLDIVQGVHDQVLLLEEVVVEVRVLGLGPHLAQQIGEFSAVAIHARDRLNFNCFECDRPSPTLRSLGGALFTTLGGGAKERTRSCRCYRRSWFGSDIKNRASFVFFEKNQIYRNFFSEQILNEKKRLICNRPGVE